jgi:hypothetical protein
MPQSRDALETKRQKLLEKIGHIGDMRQGSITEVYRCCGKPNCHCASPSDPGHGPYYAFTRKVGGKTETVQLRAGPALNKIEREVEAYRRFRSLCTELVAVNEQICESKAIGEDSLETEVKKTSSKPSKKKSRGR